MSSRSEDAHDWGSDAGFLCRAVAKTVQQRQVADSMANLLWAFLSALASVAWRRAIVRVNERQGAIFDEPQNEDRKRTRLDAFVGLCCRETRSRRDCEANQSSGPACVLGPPTTSGGSEGKATASADPLEAEAPG